MPRKTDKRIRLIEAATLLMHQQGYSLTTLADIAQEADVPLGNVYYYFKTKEAIGEAVIENRAKELHERLSMWEKNADVQARLRAFLQNEVDVAEVTARCGCPIGGLCQELAKQGGSLADAAAKLLNDTVEWSEKQFRALGYGEKARELSLQFIAAVQGIALLTNTFKDPKLTLKLTRSLEKEWFEGISIADESSVKVAEEEDALA
jgi:AcrR family transcriptional regulator